MHGHGFCKEAHRDRNLSAIKFISFTKRVVLMAVHEQQDGALQL